jgi:septal ring factor EnvC (AmiA/AmiB activator)
MNLRTTGIVVLVVLLIALLGSTIHYASKAKDAGARLKDAESSAMASSAAADATASKLAEHQASSRTEIESHRSKNDAMSKEISQLKQQDLEHARAAEEHRRTASELAAARAAIHDLTRDRDELQERARVARAEADAERNARAQAIASSDARMASTKPAPDRVPNARTASDEAIGPSIYWMDKPWYSNLDLKANMWLYRNPAKSDAQQQLEFREAEAELRRRGALK